MKIYLLKESSEGVGTSVVGVYASLEQMREHIIDLADNLWGVHSKVCEHKLEEHTDVCLLGHADESCCEGCEYRL